MKINWALVATIVAALGGVIGTVITPIYGASLTTAVQAVLQAVSALLVLIPSVHASSIVAAQAKAKASLAFAARYGVGS